MAERENSVCLVGAEGTAAPAESGIRSSCMLRGRNTYIYMQMYIQIHKWRHPARRQNCYESIDIGYHFTHPNTDPSFVFGKFCIVDLMLESSNPSWAFEAGFLKQNYSHEI